MLERADGTVVFRRTPAREVLDMVGWPLGAAMFLFGALIFGQLSLVFGIGFGLFGLLMALVSPAALRRGRKPILIVSPLGIETPESGPLRWSEVSEVRIEAERAMGGPGEHPRRLGIVPRPGAPEADIGLRAAAGIIGGLARLSSATGAKHRHSDDHALYSVGEWELQVPLERAIEAIERFVPVEDDRGRAARSMATFTEANGAAPLTPARIREMDARLAAAAAPVSDTRVVAARGSGSFVATPVPHDARWATFRRHPLTAAYTKLAEAIITLVLLPVSVLGMMSQAGVHPASIPPLFFVPVAAAALFIGCRALVTFARTARARHGAPPILIEVGPDGIRTPETGSLGWDAIADIHVAGPAGQPEEAELVLVPHDPIAPSRPRGTPSSRAADGPHPLRAIVVPASELDADFDAFVDLVRSYCPGAFHSR